MPGIFGAVGIEPRVRERLESEWRTVWSDIELCLRSDALVGGHAFQGPPFHEEGGDIIARDGTDVRASIATMPGCEAEVRGDGQVRLRADASGIFPLHYVAMGRGFAFSTLLRPLARAVEAEVDLVGVAGFVRFAHTTAGRTLYRGIRRLLPGQVVTWHPAEGISVQEASGLWTSRRDELSSPEEAAEVAAPLIRSAMQRMLANGGDAVLMMSAGWDSRTLLAAATEAVTIEQLRTFSHGDVASRELRLAAQVAGAAGVAWTSRSIGPDVWDVDHLDTTFQRTETLIFPHWSWAGRMNYPAACVFSGVLGEVLGGHYGATQVAGTGRAKGLALLRYLMPGRAPENLSQALDALKHASLEHLWYLKDDAEGGPGERRRILRELNEGVDTDLARLRARGVTTAEQLLEGYVTEHRGVQYISAQALAQRVAVDVGAPFADPDLLKLASEVPMELKVHNRLSRSIGLRIASGLLDVPMAATLVPASWPVPLQEGSRLVRRLYEASMRWAASHSGGRWSPARLGWVNFDFLRNSVVADQVIESLHLDVWDRDRMFAVLARARAGGAARSLHPFFDQMGKILTVDRMLG